MLSSRAGSWASTARFSSSEKPDQPPISINLRPQPTQKLVRADTAQTRLQGDFRLSSVSFMAFY